jgi:hypothetical protein
MGVAVSRMPTSPDEPKYLQTTGSLDGTAVQVGWGTEKTLSNMPRVEILQLVSSKSALLK